MCSFERNAEIEDECTSEIHIIHVICVWYPLTEMTLTVGRESFTAH